MNAHKFVWLVFTLRMDFVWLNLFLLYKREYIESSHKSVKGNVVVYDSYIGYAVGKKIYDGLCVLKWGYRNVF